MTDITPIRYDSYTSIDVKMPLLTEATYSIDVTNSTGVGSTTFPVVSLKQPGLNVTPTSAIGKNLPTSATLSILDEPFAEPYATGSETFTKQGTDVDYTKWIGGAVQGQGLVKNSFIGNGVSPTSVDLSSKIPNLTTTNFIGVSLWHKLKDVNSLDIIFNIGGSTDLNNVAFNLDYSSVGYRIKSIKPSPSFGAITLSVGSLQPTANEWNHLFACVDRANSTISLYVNSVLATTLYTNDLNDIKTFDNSYDSFRIGVANSNNNFYTPTNNEISNVYWSTNPLFASELYTYYNQPKESKFFERQSFTQRELFTKDVSGLGNDLPASAWKNGIAQNDGLIGKGVQATSAVPYLSTDPIPYIDISSKIPIASGDTFLGISCFFKVNQTNSLSQTIISIGTSANTGDPNHCFITAFQPSGPHPNTVSIDFNIVEPPISGLSQQGQSYSSWADNTIVVGKWYHLFVYMDFTDTIKKPHLFIDGVATDNLAGETFQAATAFTGSYDYAWINAVSYVQATGGPIYSDSDLSINNLYMSNNPDFKNKLAEYSNRPTGEIT